MHYYTLSNGCFGIRSCHINFLINTVVFNQVNMVCVQVNITCDNTMCLLLLDTVAIYYQFQVGCPLYKLSHA